MRLFYKRKERKLKSHKQKICSSTGSGSSSGEGLSTLCLSIGWNPRYFCKFYQCLATFDIPNKYSQRVFQWLTTASSAIFPIFLIQKQISVEPLLYKKDISSTMHFYFSFMPFCSSHISLYLWGSSFKRKALKKESFFSSSLHGSAKGNYWLPIAHLNGCRNGQKWHRYHHYKCRCQLLSSCYSNYDLSYSNPQSAIDGGQNKVAAP